MRIAPLPEPVPLDADHIVGVPERRCALVVEDDPTLREMMVRGLTSLGLDVCGVASGEDALTYASIARAPALISLDVVLPNLCGFSVCAALRADAKFNATKILILTTRSGWQDEASALEAGADLFLMKPLRVRDYLVAVERLLTRPDSDQ